MRHLPLLLAGLALVGSALTVPATAGAAPAPDEPALQRAIVVLKQQADPTAFTGRLRRDRLRSAEETLRRVADGAQRGLLDYLTARQHEGSVGRITPLWIRDAVSVEATPPVLAAVAARPEVASVEPDRSVSVPDSSTSAPPEPNLGTVGAPAMWDLGFRGQGVVVASMDTGVDVAAPDLAARWRGGTNSWYDPNGQHPDTPTDVSGHGTQTMSVAVGGDAGGSSIGVAPDARWIAVKIFDDRGTASSTAIHLGFQWLLDPDHDPATPDAPNVVNDSWVLGTAGCVLDFAGDLANLRAVGILPVFAAGNNGPGQVPSPANNPGALAVGGVDGADLLDPQSARGPSACSGTTAPDLVAPDTGIRTADLYGGYVSDTGTSVAAPHVTGAVALLLSALPSLGTSADLQQAALERGAVDLGTPGVDPDYGVGRLDTLAAYRWAASQRDFAVTASPSAFSTTPGRAGSATVSVAGVGGFADEVTLSVTAPAGVGATLDQTVIAGGSGTATLALSIDAGAAPGTYPVTVTGVSGDVTRTATVTVTVTAPPDFTLAASPLSRTVNAGVAASYALTIGSLNGFTGSVSPVVSGLPAEVGTARVTPATVSGAGSAALAVTTLATAPAGAYSLTVAATFGGLTHSVAVTLVVNPRDFTMTASPLSASVVRGGATTYTVALKGSGGFTGPVALAVSGTPAGVGATWSANPAGVPSSPTLRLTTSSSTPRGTFPLTLSGTSGALVHRVNVSLTVR